jgi:hypothetical protein
MRNGIYKTIAIILMLMLIGLVFQPAVSTYEIKNKELEPKKYLFETITDIRNNPDVKDFFNNIDHDDINLNINTKAAFFKILLRNPSLITSMWFNRPIISQNYLSFVYNQGNEAVKIIGEEKSVELVNSIAIKNPEIIEDLTYIINNNKELSQRISTLEIMNNELKPDEPFSDTPVICAIFCGLTVLFVINAITLYNIAKNMGASSPLYTILLLMVEVMVDIALINAGIAAEYGCWEDYPG